MIGFAALLAIVAPAGAVPISTRPAICSPVIAQPVSEQLRIEIAERDASLAAARLAGNVDRLMALYAADSVIMPEHQPRLHGRVQGTAYYRAFTARLPTTRYVLRTADILPLGDDALEWGTFTISYGGGTPQTIDGKYLHLWRRQPNGTLLLQAEVWGYLAPLADPASHWFPGISGGELPWPGVDAPVAAELAALNAADARSVQRHDTARIGQYAEDAVYLPFADAPQVGLPAISAHLQHYIRQGSGATFDAVMVGNDGFEALGGYVLEYSRFEVRWRAGADTGVTSGAGLRLWRREADCSLKKIRQIGTHDYRP
jgi:ketosteroid isomerase-like protein